MLLRPLDYSDYHLQATLQKMAFRDVFDIFAQHIIPDLYRPCILKVEMVIFFFSDKVIF